MVRCLNGARQYRIPFLATALLFLATGIWPQNGNVAVPAALSSAQIVERMRQHNQKQAEELKHYQSLRHYEVAYRGFFKTITAEMDVEVEYNASSGKSYRIVSQSGSRLLDEKVLKRAVDSEVEVSRNEAEAALTEANYRFHLAGSENLGGRPAYILEVDPIAPNKFLYKGRIWVDAADFAVAKIEAQPSKNPSSWIGRTLIHHTNARRHGFWLPERNRSESKIRIGGTAVLIIDYGTYQIVPKQPEIAQ
jgi:outer membrane lipoprotein-sorting protein